jgi:DnaJ-class molecular chaperone
MEALLPTLVQTARSLAMQSNPAAANMSEEDNRELDDYLMRTTQSLFSGGGGEGNPMGGLLASVLGGAGGGAGGANPMEMMSGLLGGLTGGSANAQTVAPPTVPQHKGDIHETIEVDLPDFYGNKEFSVKYLARQFDPDLNAAKKKKRKVTVVLPAGAPEDHIISAPDMGHYDSVTHTHGTLYIHFKLKKDTFFTNVYRRHLNKLTITFPMESFKRDALSFERTFAHPMGKLMTVSVDPHILEQAALGLGGREFITIPGMGMPRYGATPAGPLQIRVSMDVEKMEHEFGDIVLSDRFCTSQSVQVASEAYGFGAVTIRVTDPSWVHTRAESLPKMIGSSSSQAAAEVPVLLPHVVETEEVEDGDEEAVEAVEDDID